MENTEFKSPFKRVEGNEGNLCHYNTRLDTYGCGCWHNCGYCYARSLLEFRNLWNPATPKVAALSKIKSIINKKLLPGEVVRLGGMTDCFQKDEKEIGITYETIKLLNEKRIPYLIVTKSDLVADDKYIEILDKELAHIQVSITSTDDTLSKKIEPGASLPSQRIATVEKLYSLRFDVQVRLSPYIPQFVDIEIINNIKCDKILVEFLRVNSWIKKWLTNLSAPIDFDEYSLKSNGYNHLPLEKKISLMNKITNYKEKSICEDVPEHWEYWKTNFNNNPNDCCNLLGIYKK